MGVAANIKRLRDIFDLTQKNLAEVAGVTENAVSKWENGYAEPRMGAIERICACYGLSKSHLIEDDGMSFVDPVTRKPRVTPPSALTPVGSSAMVPLRVLGATHAGDPAEEIGDERLVEVPEGVARRHPQAFMLRVEGDCMDRAYPDGCLVMVDPTLEPWNGCAVVAEPEPGESVLRRYMRGQSSLMLVADSFGEHEDMVFTGGDADVRLLGTVVWFQASREETR